MTALVLWTIGAVDRAVSALRGRAQVIASGGSRTLEMPSGVSFLLAFGINTGLVGSGLWPVGLLPERKPVQPATARPHTPRYRQNPRNLALGWCPIRSFWLNQLTLCWRGLDSNFQYARELAPGRRRKKAGAIKARRSTSRGAIAAISAVIIPLIDVRALRPVSLWLAVIRKEQLLAVDFVAGDLGLTRRRGEPVAERHAHICPYLMKL